MQKMKKLALTLIMFPILLSGCASGVDLGSGWNPTRPKVMIVNGAVAPDQDQLVFPRKISGPITWTLTDPKFEFTDKGIEVDGALTDKLIRGEQVSVVLNTKQNEIVDCTRSKDGLQFTCNNRHTVPGIYKYTIRVRDRSKPDSKPIERDPQVVNM